jgi:hypothetical protein
VSKVSVADVQVAAPARDIHIDLDAGMSVALLIGTGLGLGLSWLFLQNPLDVAARGPWYRATSAFFLIIFGLPALDALAAIFFHAMLHRPILRFSDAGVSYSPPSMPWRGFTIPWNDLGAIVILTHPYWETEHLVIQARRPHRYVSARRERMAAWWNPATGSAVIAIATHWLAGGTSTDVWMRRVKEIEHAFAPEIERYHIEVHQFEE